MGTSEFSFVLRQSSIAGVGVFATHDIPAGKRVFPDKYATKKRKIKDIPAEFLKYCIFLNDDECLCPQEFDRMEIGWFINHSDKPNVAKKSEDYLIVIRDIKTGEEILMDYNQLNEPEHLKEDYYFPNGSA